MKSQKVKKEQIKKIVEQLIELYTKNEFQKAGEVAREAKPLFIEFCRKTSVKNIEFIIKKCHHFNMDTQMALDYYFNRK